MLGIEQYFHYILSVQSDPMLVTCCLAAIDFGARKAQVMRLADTITSGELDVQSLSAAERNHLKDNLFTDYLPLADLPVGDANALLEEQREFAAAIRGKGLVLVPGGLLGLLPFELLVEPAEGPQAGGGRFLVEGHRLRYAPSLTALHMVRLSLDTMARGGINYFVARSDLAGIPDAPLTTAALKSRLFRSDEENLLVPYHRVVAEFLAARWLAKRLGAGLSERRAVQGPLQAGAHL